jgi:hypothetical protein
MRARKAVWLALVAAATFGTGSAWAVSGGDYDPGKQGCTANADNSDQPDRAETGCNSLMFSLSDAVGGHTYLSVGLPQVKNHGNPFQAIDVCLDLGTGTKSCSRISKTGVTRLPSQPGTPAHPNWGKSVYFGADDNLDGGEHDSSEQVSNGPSDGGAIELNERPGTAGAWLASVLNQPRKYGLTHPLPVANAGFGACADGLCFSVQTQRRVAYQGGSATAPSRDAANYGGVSWDPESCAGPSDTPEDCGGHDLAWWHEQNGTTYVEPGIQIYEDPDPQGSPIVDYPIPAIYVGTCGVIVGGGNLHGKPFTFPKGKYTNSAGQLVFPTGC